MGRNTPKILNAINFRFMLQMRLLPIHRCAAPRRAAFLRLVSIEAKLPFVIPSVSNIWPGLSAEEIKKWLVL